MATPCRPRVPVPVRVVALAVLLLGTTALPGLVGVAAPPGTLPGAAPALVLAALFAACGLLVVHVEYRDEAHSFTLTEIPLVLGLFLVDPLALVVARVLGELLALVVLPRQSPLKVLLNTALWVAETCVALAVVAVLRPPVAEDPLSWLAVLAAVAVAGLLSNAVVHVVIRWHGAQPVLAAVAASAMGTALVNTCLGLVAVLLLRVHTASLVVLAVVCLAVFAGYRAYTRLDQRYKSLRLLHDFTVAISGTTRPDQVVQAMLHHSRALLRSEVAELVVLSDRDRDVRVVLRGGAPSTQAEVGEDGPLLRALAARGESLLLSRGGFPVQDDGYFARLGCRDGVLVPVDLGDGTRLVLGVAGRRDDVSTFDGEDRRLAETLARHAAMALENGRLIDELRVEASRREHQALHDPLTGLPNRLRFAERADDLIAQAQERGHRLAAALLDLDGFKDVNDTLGHSAGDELLQEIGQRLARSVRGRDVAARLGGDEFALLLDLGPAVDVVPGDAEAAIGRILAELEATVSLSGVDLDVRGSTGIALWPDHGDDAAELLQRADVAMYAAKADRSRVCVYDPQVDRHTPRRLQLATDLRRGIDEGQLVVLYQPKADLATGRITGTEALVRWQHPVHGRVNPDEFIPVAEQTGLITALTYAVLEQSLADAVSWARSGFAVGVAVNVSVRSLLEAEFPCRVLGLLARSGLPAERLTLELTESSIMADTGHTLSVLQQLADAGIRLSVDDFGTGYSSLAYLQRLPVTELKVDRSFVLHVATNPADRAIVRSVLDLGHSLGLSVVAEGIEDQLTWDLLEDMGCDTGQGYLLSRPLEYAQLHDWLAGSARRVVPATR